MLIDVRVSSKEMNVVLCALRLLQEELQRNPEQFALDTPLGDILTNGGLDSLPDSVDEIDDLCHRINCT